MRVLVIDDEEQIANFVMAGLHQENFAADWAGSATKGLMLGKVNSYDCAVIDIRLPGSIDGLDICRMLREHGCTFPIIMLSVTRDTRVKIDALNFGADDYLTKPFLFAELVARIRALLRRERTMVGMIIEIGEVSLDTLKHVAMRAGRPVRLNRKEFALLEYFMRNPDTLLTRAMILEHVWDTEVDQFTNTVDVHVRFLREKLDDGRRHKFIRTVHGHGYKFQP